ncbi:hypothetical protein Nepgr_021254 [Nepenthes gracilis]|uniref:Uncharacterized protein n=1 Tax=Nepenthes gracilis TaxID=150966 RepID=A0AAD3SWH7_NEPGR|nr:hypothetical protein Nepgr_021254 [Nepenthes gracilis]
MPMETANRTPSVENGISGSLSLNDNEIGAEKEQLAVEEVVSESTAQGRMLKPADYFPEEAAGAEGRASIEEVFDSIEESIPVLESVKQVVPLVEEVKHFAQSALVEVSPSYAVESKLKENGNDVLHLLDDKDKESPVIADLQPEKVEAEAILVVDEVSVNSSDVVGLTDVESGYKLSDSSASQAADLVDDVKDSESPEKSVDRVSAQAVDVKDLTVHENLEGQSLISSTPPAGQRASWKNCCGLLELFMGSSR